MNSEDLRVIPATDCGWNGDAGAKTCWPSTRRLLPLGLMLVLLLSARALASDALLTGAAFDMPGDAGGSIGLRWQGHFEETGEARYRIMLSDREQGEFRLVATIPANTHYEKDRAAPWWMIGTPHPQTHFFQVKTVAAGPLLNGTRYFVKILALIGDERFESPVFSAVPQPNWFQWAKLNNFLFMLAFSAGVLLSIRSARTHPTLFLRRIPGIDAVEEAIGRAAETGRPIIYLTGSGELTGRGDASNMSTIAATVLLGEVAKRSAASGTVIKVPHRSAIVMAIAQDLVKAAYRTAGRPDAYSDESNFFIAADQFAYTAAVDGIMLRERPAANFFIGYYYAESLLLAETGAATGAVQIAGTDAEHQLPFFITTCDYTLIGEELYAASAYLSRDPALVGTLRGQDLGKGFLLVGLVLGTGLLTLGEVVGVTIWETVVQMFYDFR